MKTIPIKQIIEFVKETENMNIKPCSHTGIKTYKTIVTDKFHYTILGSGLYERTVLRTSLSTKKTCCLYTNRFSEFNDTFIFHKNAIKIN